MKDKQYYWFYNLLFIVALIPYVGYVFPDRVQFFGFYLTGWSWLLTLMISLYYMIVRRSNINFPLSLWLPWIIYLSIYLFVDYSSSGLQLTLQYVLPIIIGAVASSFIYDRDKLHWLYKRLFLATFIIAILFVYGYVFRGGWTAFAATTPMFFLVLFSVSMGVFYMARKMVFLFLCMGLFLVPLIDMDRMGMAVFLLVFVIHYANRKVFSKIAVFALSVVIAFSIFNSKAFQEKTFFGGSGKVSDLSVNYYAPNDVLNTSGRATFIQYYQKGLKKAPVFGNGPRADLRVLTQLTGSFSEAHNDYIAVRYNYGYIGLGLLLYGFIATFINVLARFNKEQNQYKVLLQSTVLTLTIGFLLYMYSDNVLKSTIFFTNYYFALIGIVYAKNIENQE